MLQALARNAKPIAWFFTGIFYLELVVAPAIAKAEGYLPVHSTVREHFYGKDLFERMPGAPTAPAPVAPVAERTPAEGKNVQKPATKKQRFTTGPTQPEMQSFQSVNGNNMVDLFTGDFSYNIPLLDVGGYPVNLHYQSGITMDQEASWVGLGWNINPGVITRNMRGLPDDFKGGDDFVTKTISIKPNKTIGVTIGANAELFGRSQWSVLNNNGSTETVKGRAGTLGISLGVFHNTYKGWGTELGLNANINAGIGSKGSLSGGLGIMNNSQNGLDISPSLGYQLGKSDATTKGGITIGTNYNSRTGIQNLQITGEVRQHLFSYRQQNYSLGTSVSSYISFSKPSYTPTITIPYTSDQFAFTAKLGSVHWTFHPNFYVRGYGSTQKIEEADKSSVVPAYGYLYFQSAGNNQNVLLDYNREKDIAYSENAPHIAVPMYTYDTWSITGEGTGGMFRAYRGDMGYIFDHAIETKSSSDKFSLDIGVGSVAHGGIDFNKVSATTRNNPWLGENAMKDVINFREATPDFENVYFKNPGEKTAVNKEFLQAIGNDSLVRVDLSPLKGDNMPNVYATRNISLFKNNRFAGRRTLGANALRSRRDKRTQVISYLNGLEASKVGLDTVIKSYPINTFPTAICDKSYDEIRRDVNKRQKNHVSEITVLNPDGRRYVYGIPVYNLKQTEVTMATDPGNAATGHVGYTSGGEYPDNSVNNNKGKDGYFNKEVVEPYAHSFLLSGILSPDYLDLTGDGISEDDMGDAVKFNYSRIYSDGDPYKWRAPFQKDVASYNEGLKTYNRDDRGSYSYGEREVWYLNSVESKTMIATFVLETDSVRKDGFGVDGENGGIDESQRLYRLKQINLYNKSDYLKNGLQKARPVKSVHFAYSYELCKNNPGSESGSGKLTLQRVWFTYNKNNKGKQNPYVFSYHPANPDYNGRSVDRWGQYKDQANNPGPTGSALTNADYPYTLQPGVKNPTHWDSAKAAANAAPWTLTEVKLPSGGKIKVTYESDDYAYVQNKRAMQFFSLAGFGNTASATPVNNLYRPFATGNDYRFAFVNVTEAVNDKDDITRKYLDGVSTLYFKLMVRVPADQWGSGYEIIPVYANIVNYGVKPNSGNKVIWIELAPVQDNESPAATAAVQFLRLNLPAKAYPFSEPGDNFSLRTLIGMMASISDNIKNTVDGFSKYAHNKNFCNEILPEGSFIRLNNPVFKKYGGGLRVKKVEVFDNWTQMSTQQGSVYGQEYSYTKTIPVNGVPTTISSGVACYEPVIGNDENPFRVPFKLYTEKVGAMAPTDFLYAEEPFAETFFPAPMVGYSKVTVQTIHKDKKSANGLNEAEFYTAQDFPTIVEYTPIDDESKKTFNPPLPNVLQFDAKHYVTISQGFKVELNDMNGKQKSQTSYAQSDLKTPISYTYNYYRVQQDGAMQPRLSNKVAVVDSASGVIDPEGEIGKEVELMFDLREQTSTTVSGSIEANIDLAHLFPPIIFPSKIPLPSKETNRYRAIAVLKVVNRYGILDSVVHMEKGSKVSTRNMLYDSETGNVVLTQTNNEFDDPVYNFNYPAHWAYSGMGPAYKNIGTEFRNVLFMQGKMFYNGAGLVPAEKYFESGDELLVIGKDVRSSFTNDPCHPLYFIFLPTINYTRVWAIDGKKMKEKRDGIYFIDKDGKPYNAISATARIIRSGKRNLPGVSIGAITALRSPVRNVGGKSRLVFDATSEVVNASSAAFKDFWKVENVWKQYDSSAIEWFTVFKPTPVSLKFAMQRYYDAGDNGSVTEIDYPRIVAGFDQDGTDKFITRGLIKVNMSWVPSGAVITEARMDFRSDIPVNLWGSNHSPYSDAGFNYSYEGAGEETIGHLFRYPYAWADGQQTAWVDEGTLNGQIGNRVVLEDRNVDFSCEDYLGKDVTSVIQDLVGKAPEYQNLMLKLDNEVHHNPGGPEIRFMSFAGGSINDCNSSNAPCYTKCPVTLWIKYDYPQTVNYKVCRSEVLDKDTLNPYVWGILGNWRLDTAHTYFARRVQSDPTTITNTRTDGAIQNFSPYWAFAPGYLKSMPDTTRWVWNSKSNYFNRKGFEIENKDALLRHNAGLYGYNKSLPIAVAQNSKQREIIFDGFEDIGYRTDTCIKCEENGWIDSRDFNDGGVTSNASHTGRNSYQLNADSSTLTRVPVINMADDDLQPELSLPIDSTAIISTVIQPKGTGLFTRYGINWATGSINTCVGHDIEPGHTEWSPQTSLSNVIAYWLGGKPSQICADDHFMVTWEGKLQPKETGYYTFYANVDDAMIVRVNGVTLWSELGEGPWDEDDLNSAANPLLLEAGKLYDISVEFQEYSGDAYVDLRWSRDGQPRENIPLTSLYPNAAAADGSIISDTTWCVVVHPVKPSNVVLDKFSPIQEKKMVISGWVKEDQPCLNGTYTNARIRITFNNGNSTTYTARPSGPIIDGWQRIEEVITIPLNVTEMNVYLESPTVSAFFDDLRMHPYNSNMKSFVYDPVNIRLMAELDENNYATFYEYDDDGTLVRVKKETERGVKTIKETRSALLKQ